MRSESSGHPRDAGEPTSNESRDDLTSLHVRQALGGDEESLSWIVEKFSPLLLASARYRLVEPLRSLYDPEDLVNDVWMVALPKLAKLKAREGRYTPVLLKYLSTTLLNKVSNLVQKHIRGKPQPEKARAEESVDPVEQLPAAVTGVITRLARKETREAVLQSLESLSPPDREVIILRGIEQHPYQEIAAVTGDDPNTLAVRYSRALRRLQKELPESIYAEFVAA